MTRSYTPQQRPADNLNSISKVSPWLSPILYLLGSGIVLPLFFGNIQIIGRENFPLMGAVILAPTHRSRWDSLLLPYAVGRYSTGRHLRFIVTLSECRGLQGWLVQRMGGFPVDTQNPAITPLRHAVELLQQQQVLVIYPEGDIYRDGELHPLKPGIARLSLTAQSRYPEIKVQVLPISINYSQPFPRWGTEVKIHIGQPINVSDYQIGHMKQNAQHLTWDLANQLKQLISQHQFPTI